MTHQHTFTASGRCESCDARCTNEDHYPQLDMPEEYEARMHHWNGEPCE